MDIFIKYLNYLWEINNSLDIPLANWVDMCRKFNRVYQNETNEIYTYQIYNKAYAYYNLDVPKLSGNEYEIRKLIAHLFALNAHSPSGGNIGLVYSQLHRSEREFNGLLILPINRLILTIKSKAQMIARNKINLIKLSEDLFQWEFQSNSKNKNYIIQMWVDSYCRGIDCENNK